MNDKERNEIKETINECVSRVIREEIARYMRLDEMARIGFMGNLMLLSIQTIWVISHMYIF